MTARRTMYVDQVTSCTISLDRIRPDDAGNAKLWDKDHNLIGSFDAVPTRGGDRDG